MCWAAELWIVYDQSGAKASEAVEVSDDLPILLDRF